VSLLSYAVVTPVRDEAANLARQARWLGGQRRRPVTWLIVDNGSRDGTRELAESLAADHDWIRLLVLPAPEPERLEPKRFERGAPITRAFNAAVGTLASLPGVVVKLDADVSGDPDHFERLLAAFEADPELGIASGSCWEQSGGEWRQRHVTGDHVWGACRAYRRACLEAVRPLEERMGWDAVDELKAASLGWRTRTIGDLPFRHHRREGERDGSSRRSWTTAGRTCYYLGYRPWYLALRAAHNARRDPAALALLAGYAQAALRREPCCDDPAVRAEVRRLQRLGSLPARVREAVGRRTVSD
jgi:glycosyltransferase involved in cell wall biosynthesis